MSEQEVPAVSPNGNESVGRSLGLALTVIPLLTGTISFFSSAYLIWYILRGKKRRRSREEILVGLSFLNLLFSAACAMSTFTGPKELNHFDGYIIFGTIGSCNLQGWFYQVGTAVPMYNSVLSIYYLLCVKYKISDQRLRKCALPAMHASVVAFAFGTATTALFLELYNFGGMLGCWINDLEAYCQPGINLESCGRGSNHELYLWLFGGFPVLASLTITVATTAMLYCAVRSQEARAHSYEIDHRSIARSQRSRSSYGAESVFHSAENEGTYLWRRLRNKLATASRGFKISAKVRDSGVLYVVAFWITYLPFLAIELFWLAGVNPPNFIRVANVTLLPLQGFFNMIIYKMPQWKYKRSQQQSRNRSSAVLITGLRRGHVVNSLARSSDHGSREPSQERAVEAGIPMTVDIAFRLNNRECTRNTEPNTTSDCDIEGICEIEPNEPPGNNEPRA